MFWSNKKEIKELKDRLDYYKLQLDRIQFELQNPKPFKLGLAKSGKYKGMIITDVFLSKYYRCHFSVGELRWKVTYTTNEGKTNTEWV